MFYIRIEEAYAPLTQVCASLLTLLLLPHQTSVPSKTTIADCLWSWLGFRVWG